ncbi:MAG: DinB family protein [Chloroflexota bacterium]
MIDFAPLKERQLRIQDLARDLTREDLRDLTDEIIDTVLALIEDCTDEDVVFQPEDPHAYDRYASDESEVDMPWTLGHVIVHITASGEESAFLAAELARGVPFHGRSRWEVPWETVTTIEQCSERLEESRRMRLASLEMWPSKPHLENVYSPYKGVGRIGPKERFLLGLKHDADHLGQIEDIVAQAKAARSKVGA